MTVQRDLDLLLNAARPDPVLRQAVHRVERYVRDTEEIVDAARDLESRVVSGEGFDLGEIFNSAGRLRDTLTVRDTRARIEASVKRNRLILDKLAEGDTA